MMENLKRGTQIAYIPSHADGDMQHEDVEYGFVTGFASKKAGFVFCRYWSKFDPKELRTKSCSEATPMEYLEIIDTKPQHVIDKALNEFC